MQVARVDQPGGPGAITVIEAPDLLAEPGQVLVQVAAAGVNFIDTYHRSGAYPSAGPIALGREGAGTVVTAPSGSGLSEGDRVAWIGVAGSYASHVVAAPEQLVAVPDNIHLQTAAAAMLQGMTAQYLVTDTYRLGPGKTCLVHAAAGGVGLLLCQLARRAGARTIGTTSTEEKAARARAAGADHVILYRDHDFVAESRRITADRGVDVVYDSVGKTTFEGSLRALARRGTLVLFGQSSGAVAPFDPQLLARHGSLFFTRPSLFDYVARREELLARAGDVFQWIGEGSLTVTIDRALPLADAAEAHRLLESRQTAGKVLLIP